MVALIICSWSMQKFYWILKEMLPKMYIENRHFREVKNLVHNDQVAVCWGKTWDMHKYPAPSPLNPLLQLGKLR